MNEMNLPTPEERTAAERLCEDATPGKWQWRGVCPENTEGGPADDF